MNYFKQLFCKLGWHSFSYDSVRKDLTGVTTYARCKWCGHQGMVDSQGNLF